MGHSYSASGRDLHIDRPLSNVAIVYRPEGMIADLVFPEVEVPNQSDLYWTWDPADAFRKENDLRAAGTEANRITRNLSSESFYCKNYALKDSLPYEDIANADAAELFVSRQARAEAVKDRLMTGWEYRMAVKCTDSSYVGSYSVVASAWTDWTNSDPFADIQGIIKSQWDRTGFRPNRAVLSGYAWWNFSNNATVISRLYGETTSAKGRIVTIEQAAGLLELEQLLIGGAFYNTAQEGQTMTLSSIWGDNALVYYAPKAPRKDKPSYGYSFRWKKITNMQAQVFDVPKKSCEEIQVGYYQDEKVTASALSHLLTGVGSSQ